MCDYYLKKDTVYAKGILLASLTYNIKCTNV